jgi:hypothetical protein
MLALAMAICVLGVAGETLLRASQDKLGRPPATDFAAFWAGARLASEGKAASAYRETVIAPVEKSGGNISGTQYLPYQYPPVFMLLTLPLAKFSYTGAMIAFIGLGYLTWLACMIKLMPPGWPKLPLIVMPAAIMNAIIGQNGFVSATCFASALLLIGRRPVLGGACLGVFAFKPHLALAIPVALATAGRWRSFWGCCAVASGLLGLSWLVLGTAAWQAFFDALPMSRTVLQSAQTGPKVITIYEAARLLHGSVRLAIAVQAGAALVCLAIVARVARRRPGPEAETALVVSAAILCTPYAMDYDLVCLSVPIVWLIARASDTGWRPWEKTVVLAAYLLPLFVRWLGVHVHLPLGPFVLVPFFSLVAKRASSGLPAMQSTAS